MAWRQYYRATSHYGSKYPVSKGRNMWLNFRRLIGLKIKAKRIEQ